MPVGTEGRKSDLRCTCKFEWTAKSKRTFKEALKYFAVCYRRERQERAHTVNSIYLLRALAA
ncbi:hypothetical protein Z949_2717 [Sulfitobacter guttiformis KCTC 32187]|nr:hypothetical protein Z949_2717 [Sulfitobacter guttiformis KCTC 32187]